MKRFYISIVVLLLGITLSQAAPIHRDDAQRMAQSFVSANFDVSRQSADLTLVKTSYSDRGEACYYIFNVDRNGFVILAGTDVVRPLIGYSDKAPFNPDDMAPALAEYLEYVRLTISEALSENRQPDAATTTAWYRLERQGKVVTRFPGKRAVHLVQTKWNQNYPYNYYCPAASSGSGGHTYAGCVACAAAQVMKYWNYPQQGIDEYCYHHSSYGWLCANFGETIYDWENMPNTINSGSPMAQISAVATLQYHVAVAMDMNFSPSGSGAYTNDLIDRMPRYFGYTDKMTAYYRDDYTHDEYVTLLSNSFDMGWPIVHAGGGHAYVFDGYDEYGMIHMNWGWGGSGDGWFDVDAHSYTDGQRGIFNMVPADIYGNAPAAPTQVNVTAAGDVNPTATLSWVNPSQSLDGSNLTAIDAIIIERNGQVIHVENNVTPGATMSFVDDAVPCYDMFIYTLYAVLDGQQGRKALSEKVYLGPTCEWEVVMQSSNISGWKGGYLTCYNAEGTEMCRVQHSVSGNLLQRIDVPYGTIRFAWTAPISTVNNMGFIIRDAQSQSVYTYSGSSALIPSGILYEHNNDCGSGLTQATPYNVAVELNSDEKAVLTWDCDETTEVFGYSIYRDEHLAAFVRDGRTFVDEGFVNGHCYSVRALGAGGESGLSSEVCITVGSCNAPTDLWFEILDNHKVKLTWTRPEETRGLTGYYLYRRTDSTDYERIKLLGASATSHTDGSLSMEGNYYYRLYAYYRENDCTSTPASIKYNPDIHYLHVYYSPTGIEEHNGNVVVYPNPANQILQVEGEDLTEVMLFNALGQMVSSRNADGNSLSLSTADLPEGLYVMKVVTKQGISSVRVSVVH